ncbi:MAG: DNA polymerase, partial [Acidimicrobiales bacterium]
MADDPLILIDGNSLTYRAFFALPTDLSTASGQVTNAVFGFTSMLINLMRDHGHRRMAVAFDRPEPTFRHERVDTYKANRQAAPDILRQQMGLVRQVAETLGIRVLELPGYEADDIIATLATQGRDAGLDVIVVTGDRDVYQLVEDPHVKVLYNRRGVSDYVLYDEAGIEDRTGVPPALYLQYAALRGDTSDNLPGVPGVGEKTAAKLVTTYGGIDGIFEHLDDQTPKLRSSLAEHEDQVRENAELMKLICDAPVGVTIDELDRRPPDVDEVRHLFDFLEFHSLAERLTEALGEDLGVGRPPAEVLEAEVAIVESPPDASALLARLREDAAGASLAVAAAWEGSEGRTPLEGLAIVTDPAAGEVAWIAIAVLTDDAVRAELARLVALPGEGGRPVAAHQAKAMMRSLLDVGVDVRCLAIDTAIAAYLLDPAESRYLLDEVLRRFAGAELPADGAAPEGQLDLDGSTASAAERTARYALAVDRLVDRLTQALDHQALRALNDEIEVPLVRVLAHMEHAGVGVDAEELRGLRDRLTAEVDSLRQQVYDDAGTEFNVNSTPQLREILFDKLGLTPQKRTKTGYSTDASSLEKL